MGLVLLFTACQVSQAGAASLGDPPSQDALEEEGRAAVVVQFGEGEYVVRMVDFEAPYTGLDLLVDSDLGTITQDGLVCKIGPKGCASPREDCMCQLPRYWSYWHWEDGQWQFSGVGVAGYAVTDGAIDGWAWGRGGTSPPDVEVEALFDLRRVAPGLPQVAFQGGDLVVSAPFEGDENGNVQAFASYRVLEAISSDELLELICTSGICTGTLAGPQTRGRYEVEVTFSDPDGVRGSARWTMVAYVEDARRINLPLVLSD